jgi:protoporphyrinogen oxidase
MSLKMSNDTCILHVTHYITGNYVWFYRENICVRQAGASGTNDNLIVTGRLQKLASVLRYRPASSAAGLIVQAFGTANIGIDGTLQSS